MVPGWVGLGPFCWWHVEPRSIWPKGTLECVVLVDPTECAWLVHTQWGVVPRCIWLCSILGWPVFCGIVGRVWLLTASLRLIVALVPGLIIPSFPLLIIGG